MSRRPFFAKASKGFEGQASSVTLDDLSCKAPLGAKQDGADERTRTSTPCGAGT
jgi:hypothetical protein